MDIPILADKSMEVAKAYGVLKEEDGIAYRGLFIIDSKQNLRQVSDVKKLSWVFLSNVFHSCAKYLMMNQNGDGKILYKTSGTVARKWR